MNPIDDLFREGLSGHAGEVPADMWSRVNAGKTPIAPVGEAVDQLFAGKLADRAGEVPVDMWARITAVGAVSVAEGAEIDQTFADKLKDAEGEIPDGMWQRIWLGVTAPAPAAYPYRRWLVASLAALLLLSGLAWWQLAGDATPVQELTVPTEIEVVASNATAAELPDNDQAIVPADQTENYKPGGIAVQPAVVAGSGAAAGATTGTHAQDATSLALQASDEAPAGGLAEAGLSEKTAPTAAASSVDESLPAKTEGVLLVDAEEVTTAVDRVRTNIGIQEPSSRSLALLPLKETSLEVKHTYRVEPIKNSSFRAAPRHRFQTEFLFGIAYANQSFSVNDESNRLLLNAREVSEYPEASYQVTLRTNYRMGDRLILTGGFTYSEIRNQMEYDQTVNGTPTSRKINNSIRLLEAPLLIGYRMPGRRLHVAINAGPVVNLSTSARGRFLHPDASQPLDLATDGNYRRNIGVGFMTSLSSTYRIGNKDPFLLVVEPFFKTYPGTFSVKEAPLKEAYWIAGLQLGVRKEF